jgi:hypothetical protein
MYHGACIESSLSKLSNLGANMRLLQVSTLCFADARCYEHTVVATKRSAESNVAFPPRLSFVYTVKFANADDVGGAQGLTAPVEACWAGLPANTRV